MGDEVGDTQEEDANQCEDFIEFGDWGEIVGQVVFPDAEEGEDSEDGGHPQHADQLLLHAWFAVVEDVAKRKEEVDQTCNDKSTS